MADQIELCPFCEQEPNHISSDCGDAVQCRDFTNKERPCQLSIGSPNGKAVSAWNKWVNWYVQTVAAPRG